MAERIQPEAKTTSGPVSRSVADTSRQYKTEVVARPVPFDELSREIETSLTSEMPAWMQEPVLGEPEPEVTIVMPCLNEKETVGVCVEKAILALKTYGIQGEVLVSDNGSTDGSIEIARAAGARVVHAPRRGYGNAYLKGFDEARGKYILMADSDDTYDFFDLPRFLEPLRQGHDLVMGNRFKGEIMKGAMPWHHRYIGNPILSGLLNLFFNTGIGDAHCGMRAFSQEAYQSMRLQTGGMEFASEMVIHASKAGLDMTEVPIRYYPRLGESKLHSFRDGWRHLRFMLLYSPTHLYLWPGATLMLIGFIVLAALMFGPVTINGTNFGVNWMLIGSLLMIVGFQVITLGFFARVFSLTSHIDTAQDRVVSFFSKTYKLENGLVLGSLMFGVGIATYLAMLFGDPIKLLQSIRMSILALTFSIIGVQTIFASFFVSMMVIKRKGW